MLLDSPFREIHALRLADDGTIYAAAVNGTQGGDEPRLPIAPPHRAGARAGAVGLDRDHRDHRRRQRPVAARRRRSTAATRRGASGRGAIYRIRPDGLWDTMWETGEDAPYDLLIEPGGSLLVGTGTEGKIFRVSGDPARATLLARAAARQVTALLREPSGRIVGATSNPGKLFALSRRPARRGTYESDVRDAGTVASWGVIRWRAIGAARARCSCSRAPATPRRRTRPGARGRSRTRNADGEQIASPNARYLQWRAVLTADGAPSPVLTSVTTAYLPRNLRPEVSSITVHPPGTVFQRPFSTGEMEIAGFEDNTSDGRAAERSRSAAPAGRRHRRRPRSAAASTRRDCRRSSGRPTTRTTIGCSTTCSTGARARRRGRR